MAGHEYRLTADGPLHEVFLPRPGVIAVRITWDHGLAPIAGHVHRFEHTMHVERGAVRLLGAGGGPLAAGESAAVPAGVLHALLPLEPGTVCRCEHAIRAGNGAAMPDAFSADGIPLEWVDRLTVEA